MKTIVVKCLRYVKGWLLLPVRHAAEARQAAAHRQQMEDILRTLAGQQQTTHDLIQAQTAALAQHVSQLLWEELPRLMNEQFQGTVAGPVQGMTNEFRILATEHRAEQQAVTDRHAACYDRLVEQVRRLAEAQQELARQLEAVRASSSSLRSAA